MKRMLAGAVVVSMVAFNAFAETQPKEAPAGDGESGAVVKDEAPAKVKDSQKPSAQPASSKEDSWIGKIEKKDAKNVEFVSGGRKFEITGAAEKELLKEIGKEMKLTGTLDGTSIEVVKAEPITVTK